MDKMNEAQSSPWDGTRFPREQTTGVIMGLNLTQTITAGIAVVAALVAVMIGGFPQGVIVAMVLVSFGAGLAIPKFGGRAPVEWAGICARYAMRGARGQLAYVQRESRDAEVVYLDREEPSAQTLDRTDHGSGRDEKGRIVPGRGSRFRLPGETNELRVYTLPTGAAFVFDPRRGEGMICAKLATSKGFDLESFDTQEDRTGHWRDGISVAARLPGVARVQCSDQTTLVSGSKVKEFYESKAKSTVATGGRAAGQIEPFLHASLEDLMSEATDTPVHEMWMTLVLSRDTLSRRIKALGGGLPAFMEVALAVMSTIEGALPTSGTSVVAWHSPRSLAALSRSAFDPDSTVMISERAGDWVGVSPESAGPVAMEAFADHVRTDGFLHRTYKVSEYPQSQARLGFLDALVFAGDFRHTVTSYYGPTDSRAALRKLQRRKADWKTSDRMLGKLDRQPSLEHEREWEDIAREEAELVEGHAALWMSTLVTVTGRDEMELEANCGDLLARAVTASVELRKLYLEQDAGMVAAALPFAQVERS